MLTKKKVHNLKLKNYVLFSRDTEDLSSGKESQIALRDYSEEVRKEPEYTRALPKEQINKTGSQNMERLLLKKHQASQVHEFSSL